MYESPIELFSMTEYAKRFDEKIENAVYEAVLKVAVNVNREELIKALEYDRNQYEKGYADGKKDGIGWILVTERLPEESGLYLCSIKAYDTNNYVLLGRFSMNRFNLIDVEAWMPLPKPYEEGAEK